MKEFERFAKTCEDRSEKPVYEDKYECKKMKWFFCNAACPRRSEWYIKVGKEIV